MESLYDLQCKINVCFSTDLDAEIDRPSQELSTMTIWQILIFPEKKKGGVKPSDVNFPKAGKRPFSSMSPAILTNGSGDVQLVIGASGGKRITTAVSLV